MGIRDRLRRLEEGTARQPCAPGVIRITEAAALDLEPAGEPGPCPRCGGDHAREIEEIVAVRPAGCSPPREEKEPAK